MLQALHRLLCQLEVQPDATRFDAAGAPLGFHFLVAPVSNLMLKGKPIQPNKKYKIAGWAPVAEGAQGEPIWEVVAGYLRDKKTIRPRKPNLPKIISL